MLPFRFVGDAERWAALANALPDELIADLARLHWLFITARGSSFRLRADAAEFGEIGRLLGVRYCLTGTVEVSGKRLVVMVELVHTADGGVVWADRFSGSVDDVHAMREQIRSQVLVALEIRIPLHEAALARQAPVENLDAWSAYHLGLQHLYRFNRVDNAAAAGLFERALALDPGLARAHAGLSFVHFQTAFMHYADDVAEASRRGAAVVGARGRARSARSLRELHDGAHLLARGGSRHEPRLARARDPPQPELCPGDLRPRLDGGACRAGAQGREHVDAAMRLSPLDPLHYAMQATRAFTHLALGEDAEAALWAERGARSPGAHVLIAMIAAAAHGAERRRREPRRSGRQRSRAQRRAHPRRLRPRLPDEVRRDAGARARGAGRARVVSPGGPSRLRTVSNR